MATENTKDVTLGHLLAGQVALEKSECKHTDSQGGTGKTVSVKHS